MNIEEFRAYCLAKKGVTEEFPFGPETLVFKVMGKMFALTGLDSPEFKVNLKCEPELAIELREKHMFVQPGYHMSKIHWNTVNFDEANVGNKTLKEWIDISYLLVVDSLPKKVKEELK
ncbi:MAG: MmcQ/YjbR family DNA-binding protein [Chitinophagales bacterium]|nr:MmcQ/YjbR family DNA-binding protein [Chitinophagales bacterium]